MCNEVIGEEIGKTNRKILENIHEKISHRFNSNYKPGGLIKSLD